MKFRIDEDFNRSGEIGLRRHKIFFFVDNQSIIDNLIGRGSEPYKYYKKELIPKLMELVKENHPQYYDELKDVKWSWNRRCGCILCPCSPGFMGESNNNPVPLTVYVHI